MKLFKSLIAAVCAVAFLASTAVAKQADCCKKAAADGKTCSHKCCVAAAKEGKECTKCGGEGDAKKAEKTEKKEEKKP